MYFGREWSMHEMLLSDEPSSKLAIERAILVAVADLPGEDKEGILEFSKELITVLFIKSFY